MSEQIAYLTQEQALATLTEDQIAERIAKLGPYYDSDTIASINTSNPLPFAAIKAFGDLAAALGLSVTLESYAMTIKVEKTYEAKREIVANNLRYEIHAAAVKAAEEAIKSDAATA